MTSFAPKRLDPDNRCPTIMPYDRLQLTSFYYVSMDMVWCVWHGMSHLIDSMWLVTNALHVSAHITQHRTNANLLCPEYLDIFAQGPCPQSLHWRSLAVPLWGGELSPHLTSDHIDYMILRYRSRIHRAYDIVEAIHRTIWCTNARLSHALLLYCSGASASDWCRLPCTPSVALSASHSLW